MKVNEKKLNEFLQRYYFDTSSINKLAQKLSMGDCIATRKLIADRKKQWIISPLNLYEIFGIRDSKKREDFIYKISNLFPKPGIILDIPTRILFSNILSYNPKEQVDFEKSIREAWFNASRDGRTFEMDFIDFHKRTKILENFTKAIKFVLKKNTCIAEDIDDLEDEVRAFLEPLKIIQPTLEIVDKNQEKEFYVKIMLIFAIFCFGVEPDSSFLDGFWNTQKINNKYNDKEKYGKYNLPACLYHMCTTYEEQLFTSHEINLMVGYILYEHAHKGINRGTLRDALHLVYAYECGFFVSDDRSILGYAEKNIFLKYRVVSVKDDFTFQEEN